MILDLPPETVQAIIAKAEMQGVTPAELLTKDYSSHNDFALSEMERQGLNSDGVHIVLTEQDAKTIQAHLDNPPPPTPFMQEILKRANDYV